jgi:hypothetical protein
LAKLAVRRPFQLQPLHPEQLPRLQEDVREPEAPPLEPPPPPPMPKVEKRRFTFFEPQSGQGTFAVPGRTRDSNRFLHFSQANS